VKGRPLAVVVTAAALALAAAASGSLTDHGGNPYAVSVVDVEGTRNRVLFSNGRWLGHELSADRRFMAYSHGRYYGDVLYTAQVPGTIVREIAQTKGLIWDVRWSPDGRRLAFWTDDDRENCRYAVWVTSARKGQPSKIADCATHPSWAPGSTRLAYVSRGQDAVVTDLRSGVSTVVARYPNGLSALTWSPRGERMAFIAGRKLHVFRFAGRKDLAVAPGDDGASWAPDGRRLAFVGRNGLSLIDRDGARFRVLDRLALGRQLPSWSPDGRWIAYVRFVPRPCRWCGAEVFVVPAAGGRPRRLTNESANRLDGPRYVQFGPLFWSRDSRRIFYLHYVHFGG
jgi:Tol biopolymer transport system component